MIAQANEHIAFSRELAAAMVSSHLVSERIMDELDV